MRPTRRLRFYTAKNVTISKKRKICRTWTRNTHAELAAASLTSKFNNTPSITWITPFSINTSLWLIFALDMPPETTYVPDEFVVMERDSPADEV